MTPGWTGRVYACPFCGTQVQVAIGADQIAAGMALDLANMELFLAQLANTLSAGFSEHTRIEANGRTVLSVEIELSPDVFIAKRNGRKVLAQHKRVVRGIALKTATLPLDQWVQMLTQSLANHANQNARAAWVLAQLGGSR